MWKRALGVCGLSVVFGSCLVWADSPQAENRTRHAPFADFGFLPPPERYSGRVFRLSQAYPASCPADSRLPSFFTLDFRTQWRAYLLAVRDYCFEGNLVGDGVEDHFQVAVQVPPRWFHMPWQHFGPMGREGIHGLTKEAPIQPRQLCWSQTANGQTYAVAFYNEFGGFEIGKVWQDPNKPELHDIRFPQGTVVFKLLFADIPTEQVPFLQHPVVWQAYITETFASNDRKIKDLALIQMDIMVRDERSPCGWLFGTFQYNGALANKSGWENLVPVGIQWGDDPGVRAHQVNLQPIATARNPELKETIINDNDKELPPTHLGWNGRLNGPVDNPMSSCMSCHATAQVLEKSPLSPLFQENPPLPGSDAWMRWFQNYKCGSRFDKEVPSADFSLQLAISVKNFIQWRGEAKGISATNYIYRSQKAHSKSADDPFREKVIENGKPTAIPKIQRNF